MKYRVHRIDVKNDTMQEKLELFINKLNGEIVSIIPNVRPTFQLMGATAKIDYLLIVEKQQQRLKTLKVNCLIIDIYIIYLN